MKEYTEKQKRELRKNPYVLQVTKHKIYYTAKFKEDLFGSAIRPEIPLERSSLILDLI